VPLVLGLLITAGLVVVAVQSGYSYDDLVIVALVMGAAFTIAITVSYRLAPKIGYWACLVAPLVSSGIVAVVLGLWIAIGGG